MKRVRFSTICRDMARAGYKFAYIVPTYGLAGLVRPYTESCWSAGLADGENAPQIRNWPAIWAILEKRGVAWGCGNGHVHQTKPDAIIGLPVPGTLIKLAAARAAEGETPQLRRLLYRTGMVDDD